MTRRKSPGEVSCKGTLKGIYGKDRVPVLEARFRVRDGAAKYTGMPYALEKLDVDIEGLVDLQKEKASFVQVNRLCVKGTDVDVDIEGRVDELITNPPGGCKDKSRCEFFYSAKDIPAGGRGDDEGKFECGPENSYFVG